MSPAPDYHEAMGKAVEIAVLRVQIRKLQGDHPIHDDDVRALHADLAAAHPDTEIQMRYVSDYWRRARELHPVKLPDPESWLEGYRAGEQAARRALGGAA